MNDKGKSPNVSHDTVVEHPRLKPVFTKLTPEMSREQMRKNLVSALERSGIKVKRS
jgi:dihydroorotate dehydrogenase